MDPISPAAPRLATLDPWACGAALVALATLWWGLLLLRRISGRYDRILVGLVGLVGAYHGLHLAVEPHGWAWFANAFGVGLCMAAMGMLQGLVRQRTNAQVALRLSEARERWQDAGAPLQLTLASPQMAILDQQAEVLKKADMPRTILDSAPMAMFAVGLDGSVNYWNAAAERTFGWRRDEVLGHRMPSLVAHPGADLFSGPIHLISKDGEPVAGPVQSVPVRDARGAVSGILTIVTTGAA